MRTTSSRRCTSSPGGRHGGLDHHPFSPDPGSPGFPPHTGRRAHPSPAKRDIPCGPGRPYLCYEPERSGRAARRDRGAVPRTTYNHIKRIPHRRSAERHRSADVPHRLELFLLFDLPDRMNAGSPRHGAHRHLQPCRSRSFGTASANDPLGVWDVIPRRTPRR